MYSIDGRAFMHLPLGSRVRIFKETPTKFILDLPDGTQAFFEKPNVKDPLEGTSLDTRQALLHVASELQHTFYLWGGMSPTNSNLSFPSGIDCSGLVHLSYRVNGIEVPRDAYEQWMKAKPIKRAELKPADLIFSAKSDNPKKITHVAIYAGNGQIIEAPQTGMVVRKISFQEKYGKALDKVESGDTVGERVVYFGSFLQK